MKWIDKNGLNGFDRFGNFICDIRDKYIPIKVQDVIGFLVILSIPVTISLLGVVLIAQNPNNAGAVFIGIIWILICGIVALKIIQIWNDL